MAHIEALFARMDREDAKATARARAQAKAQNLSPEETEALIKQAIQDLAYMDKPKSPHVWQKGAKLAPVPNAEELRSGLSRLLGIGKRD